MQSPMSPRDQNLYFEVSVGRIKESYPLIIYNQPLHKKYRFSIL